jgi:apolipoprotein D and lipocalin family protein
MRVLSVLTIILALLTGCQSTMRPITTVDQVDLERFMGDWYVIASIPTWFERDAYNAVETYELEQDDTVQTTFTYRHGGFDKPLKTMTPTGFVRADSGNAVWGMQFIWPFKAEYRVVYLDPDYSRTIIGRSKRDYAWIMAREPSISDQAYDEMIEFLRGAGYDVSEVRRVPQQWPDTGSSS